MRSIDVGLRDGRGVGNVEAPDRGPVCCMPQMRRGGNTV